tara:strand:+ start:67 stop:654 length:588 start_codon:yes stop_codon:yes gene_type:complete
MAITYPRNPPDPFNLSRLSLTGVSAVSRNTSPFTLQTQQYNHAGQAWLGSVDCPPMVRADAETMLAFLLSAQRGTFYFQDYANTAPRGAISGTLEVTSATANSSTLTYSGTTSGTQFALGDWLQISTSLYKVIQLNGVGNVDVFPVLRKSYAATTSIVKTNAKGVFRLAQPTTEWSIELASVYGISFSIVEDVET